ncbi:MAG TPA: ABC transporter permease, partial [Lachnospiraceae bacterium]|nr:ABC transporter permease [Lachnospiraceae bacterium]
WGVMISDARTYFRSYPVMLLAPGLGITLFSLGINLTGDALCELLSVKKRSENHREI